MDFIIKLRSDAFFSSKLYFQGFTFLNENIVPNPHHTIVTVLYHSISTYR